MYRIPVFTILSSGPVTAYAGPPTSLGALVPSARVVGSVVQLPGGVVACGPMFDARGSEYLLRDDSNRTHVASRHPGIGATVRVRGGVALVDGGAVDDAPVCVQGYPQIVHDRRNLASRTVDAETVGRVALVVLTDGRIALAVGTCSMHAFAESLVALGAVHAVYLDGGSSTYVRAPSRTIGGDARALPSFVLLRPTHATDTPSTVPWAEIVALLALSHAVSKRR
jgi:hypothetical protein